MSDSNDELEEMLQDVLEWEMRAAKTTGRIDDRYTIDEINEAANGVIPDIIDKVDNDRNLKILLVLVSNLGQSLGSEEIAKEALSKLQELKERQDDK